MARSRRVLDLLDRLAAAEAEFLRREFLAPLPSGGTVHVGIAGAVCRLRVEPADFRGWGVFRPTGPTAAALVRPATLAERQDYLRLFPRVRLVVGRRRGRDWLGGPAHPGNPRAPADDVPLWLAEEVEPFDVVEARGDGRHFWFDRLDSGHDPAAAAYLRDALRAQTPPAALSRPGLTPGERAVYARTLAEHLETDRRARRGQAEGRLRDALAHAGADLHDFLERDDSYRVTYRVGGRRHVSVVRRDDLTVEVAGVCLAGADRRFDLQSLAGVLRQAVHVLRVGRDNGGIAEEQYWQIHPPTE